MAKKIIITGGTGFIGTILSKALILNGYEVIVLSRTKEKQIEENLKIVRWNGKTKDGWQNHAENAFAIINLAGENIGAGRWTEKRKRNILESRINAGNAIVDVINSIRVKPKVLIQPSGIGYYGNRGNEILDETSANGKSFLPVIAREWENSINMIDNSEIRVVILRIGVVLAKNEGFLKKVTLPVKFFLGGHFGNGKQWMSWVHIQDLIDIVQLILANEQIKGILNVTSAYPVTSKEFFRTLGAVLHRPSFISIPAPFIRLLFGEMGEELILTGQRAIPKKLLDIGYRFKFPELKPALLNIFHN